jgi:8-amino-7-oxononanoate synthase
VFTILVSGSDTGIGKTRVTGLLARRLAALGHRVQIVKPVESGRAEDRDAERARKLAATAAETGGGAVEAHTLVSFTEPLAPLAAAALEGRAFGIEDLVATLHTLPAAEWRLIEGAGGLAVPLDADGRDWADFARLIEADAVLLVVPDRLGAINQARLTLAYAKSHGLHAGLCLNACAPADAAVAAANRSGLGDAPIWIEAAFDAEELHLTPLGETALIERPKPSAALTGAARWETELRTREAAGLLRHVRVNTPATDELNLAGNDYLELAHDPAVVEAAVNAARTHGASASAAPLITGWHAPHEELVQALCAWHGFAEGLVWTSGFAANAGVLGTLPRAGDLVLADRLIHHSMVAGILKSGARLQRYPHLDLDALERLLERATETASAPDSARRPARAIFVVTESVFSMDGDHPDLRRIAALRRRFGFVWILDEAHALGWYGRTGAGLAEEHGVAADVDILVGTGGKTLGAGGAYTLFHGGPWRSALINHAGEFIYSTALPPPTAAAARAAVARVQTLALAEQTQWRATSRNFRTRLRAAGWAAADGDSPIVPVPLGGPEQALALAERLRAAGVRVAAIRPPTVPAGTSRLRFSITRTFGEAEAARVLAALGQTPAQGNGGVAP